jgi:hypothetical protein
VIVNRNAVEDQLESIVDIILDDEDGDDENIPVDFDEEDLNISEENTKISSEDIKNMDDQEEEDKKMLEEMIASNKNSDEMPKKEESSNNMLKETIQKKSDGSMKVQVFHKG